MKQSSDETAGHMGKRLAFFLPRWLSNWHYPAKPLLASLHAPPKAEQLAQQFDDVRMMGELAEKRYKVPFLAEFLQQ